MELEVIARIENDYTTKFGVPRQSGLVEEVVSRIVFEPKYRVAEAIRGMEGFSHLWLIWGFHEARQADWHPTVRPPRLGGNERIGVFATRSPYRPNALGLSSVRLDRIEKTDRGMTLLVTGADLMNGTPLYDIKPYLSSADCHPEATGGFTQEREKRRVKVDLPEAAARGFTPEQRSALRAVLSEDPRPAYQEDPDRIYAFEFGGKKVRFRVEGSLLTVLAAGEAGQTERGAAEETNAP